MPSNRDWPIAVIVSVVLLNLTIWGGIIYVVVHFARKFW